MHACTKNETAWITICTIKYAQNLQYPVSDRMWTVKLLIKMKRKYMQS